MNGPLQVFQSSLPQFSRYQNQTFGFYISLLDSISHSSYDSNSFKNAKKFFFTYLLFLFCNCNLTILTLSLSLSLSLSLFPSLSHKLTNTHTHTHKHTSINTLTRVFLLYATFPAWRQCLCQTPLSRVLSQDVIWRQKKNQGRFGIDLTKFYLISPIVYVAVFISYNYNFLPHSVHFFKTYSNLE